MREEQFLKYLLQMPVVHKYENSELDILIEKELLIREQFDEYLHTHEAEISVQYFKNKIFKLYYWTCILLTIILIIYLYQL